MSAIASLLGLAIGLSVIFSIWRISGNLRVIRQHMDRWVELSLAGNVQALRDHFDRVDRLVAEAGKTPKLT